LAAWEGRRGKWEMNKSKPRPVSPNGSLGQVLAATPAGHFAQTFPRESPTDPDLKLILERRPTLPEPIKAAIRTLVASVAGPS